MQLRCALIEVADLQVLSVPEATNQGDHGNGDGNRRHFRAGEVRKRAPERMIARGLFAGLLDRLLADPHVGDRHWQQDQVGQDDHRHTQRSADGQLADHTDIDQQEGDETHRIGQQRHHSRNEKLAERHACCRHRIFGIARSHGDPVDLLHAVGNTDGEYQERHQHRIGV